MVHVTMLAVLSSALLVAQAAPAMPESVPPPQDVFAEVVRNIRHQRSLTRQLVTAHRETLKHLPPKVMLAELDLACEALLRARKEAQGRLAVARGSTPGRGARTGVGAPSTPGTRLRLALVAGSVWRAETATWCRTGPGSGGRTTPSRNAARRLSATVALLDLSAVESRRLETFLLAPMPLDERKKLDAGRERFTVLMEACERLGIHDALVRNVARLQLTVRPGGAAPGSAEASAAHRLREALSALEREDERGQTEPAEPQPLRREMPVTRT